MTPSGADIAGHHRSVTRLDFPSRRSAITCCQIRHCGCCAGDGPSRATPATRYSAGRAGSLTSAAPRARAVADLRTRAAPATSSEARQSPDRLQRHPIPSAASRPPEAAWEGVTVNVRMESRPRRPYNGLHASRRRTGARVPGRRPAPPAAGAACRARPSPRSRTQCQRAAMAAGIERPAMARRDTTAHATRVGGSRLGHQLQHRSSRMARDRRFLSVGCSRCDSSASTGVMGSIRARGWSDRGHGSADGPAGHSDHHRIALAP